MSTTIVTADSVLAIDVGSVNTRAVLFDVVDGRYRFLACGNAPTTLGAPYQNVTEGVHMALEELQEITGRRLLGANHELITPTQPDGSGIDQCVVTFSAGRTLNAVVVGLLEDISLQSAHNLVNTTYASIQEVISLNDRRKTAARLDAIIRARPDVVVIAGGTDKGASQSVEKLLEPVGLACYLMPKELRPQVLYTGNQALTEEVKTQIGPLASLHTAPNVRPELETETLLPAQAKLAGVYRQARAQQIPESVELDRWAKGNLLPSAMAFGRTIRFISKEYAKTRKGVLGVDVGSAHTTIAAGFAGDLSLSVSPHLGVGEGSLGILAASSLEEVTRWLPVELEDTVVRDYIYSKSLNPASLPVTEADLAIEQAMATQALQIAMKKAMRSFPESVLQASEGALPQFEPIIAAGSVLGDAPLRGQILLMLLNALQPSGVTTLAVDQNKLAASLGAAAEVAPLLTVQSLDASNFVNLCTVISPVGKAPVGTPILHLNIKYDEGNESNVEVKNGAFELIPLPQGQVVNIHLQPLHRFDVGWGGPGRSGSLKVIGGQMGLVIDARGRPLVLPTDAGRRLEQVQKWHWAIRS